MSTRSWSARRRTPRSCWPASRPAVYRCRPPRPPASRSARHPKETRRALVRSTGASAASLTPQIRTERTAGTHCVEIYDTGGLPADIEFAIRIVVTPVTNTDTPTPSPGIDTFSSILPVQGSGKPDRRRFAKRIDCRNVDDREPPEPDGRIGSRHSALRWQRLPSQHGHQYADERGCVGVERRRRRRLLRQALRPGHPAVQRQLHPGSRAPLG